MSLHLGLQGKVNERVITEGEMEEGPYGNEV